MPEEPEFYTKASDALKVELDEVVVPATNDWINKAIAERVAMSDTTNETKLAELQAELDQVKQERDEAVAKAAVAEATVERINIALKPINQP